MEIQSDRVEEVFSAALDIPDRAARAAYLGRACGGDHALRGRVEVLLASHDAGDSFLETPAQPATVGDPARPLTECPGSLVGRYKLLQLIGEGGFGTVFMAQQNHPVRRTVALKVIKLGMDTKQVIARFEAERQALALMDHPNIARVLDAGATDAGRPYFVMELVRGVPITEYCDANNLSTCERLELFVPVCHAVQHAHQKGVIHRDIKPSNIMVTMADGRPIPKVIDFGIAKATNSRLTEMTLFTEYRQMVGTPEYMSPEQAESTGIDVDTRSDVYSLGVLLYELLTGTTPFDPRELRSKAYGEIQRIIREVDPPRPSTRISSLGATLATTAAHRRSEPRKLGQLMRGELDWIVMKALEKDRTRRYETANGLAADVTRHLDNDPVSARPSSTAYRAAKFARKHRTGVAAATALAGALVLGVAGTTLMMVRATTQRDRAVKLSGELDHQRGEALYAKARAEAAKAQAERDRAAIEMSEDLARGNLTTMRTMYGFIGDMVTTATSGRRDPDITVHQMLDQTLARIDLRQPPHFARVEAAMRETLGKGYQGLGRFAQAEVQIQKAICLREEATGDANHPAVAENLITLGALLVEQKRFDEALPALERALHIYRHADTGTGEMDRMATLVSLRHVSDAMGRRADAEHYARQAAELRARLGMEDAVPPVANTLNEAYVRMSREDYVAAERLLRNALDLHREVTEGHDDRTLITLYRYLGSTLTEQGRYADAEVAYTRALAVSERLLGRDHPEAVATLDSFAAVLRAQRKVEQAGATEMRYLALQTRIVSDALRHNPAAELYYRRGDLLCRAGRFREALPDFDKAIDLDPDDHMKYAFTAPAYLYAGDIGGYRRVCRQLVQRFQASADQVVWERLTKASLIEPDPEVDTDLFARLLERALAHGKPHRHVDWLKTARGLLDYRRGRYEQAIQALEGLPEQGRMHCSEENLADRGRMEPYGRGIAGLVLAMAQAQAGQTEQARRTMVEVDARLDALSATPGVSDLGAFDDWCTYQVLLTQAQSVMNSPPAPDPESTRPGRRNPAGGTRRAETPQG